jgi:catechol 2,3-dioxygenase
MADQPTKTGARRAGVLGVHSLDHFALTVPDLGLAQSFYDHFGLDAQPAADTLHLRSQGNGHVWAMCTAGKQRQLTHLSFGAFADDMPRFRERLKTLGVAMLPAPPDGDSDNIRFQDCDGTAVEIRAAEKTSPDRRPRFDLATPASMNRNCPVRSAVERIHPRRLAHVLLFARDLEKSIAFYCDALGLRVSDRVPGVVAFLHAPHGSDHHVVAFVQGAAPGLHHCSWDVGSLHDIGQGAMHMAAQGYAEGWGLGRHVLGSNYFHYIRDPWGSFAEYAGEIDYIPADMDWKASVETPENGFYLWGPDPPADFTVNYEAEPDAWRARR